jgi:hypothetical protein
MFRVVLAPDQSSWPAELASGARAIKSRQPFTSPGQAGTVTATPVKPVVPGRGQSTMSAAAAPTSSRHNATASLGCFRITLGGPTRNRQASARPSTGSVSQVLRSTGMLPDGASLLYDGRFDVTCLRKSSVLDSRRPARKPIPSRHRTPDCEPVGSGHGRRGNPRSGIGCRRPLQPGALFPLPDLDRPRPPCDVAARLSSLRGTRRTCDVAHGSAKLSSALRTDSDGSLVPDPLRPGPSAQSGSPRSRCQIGSPIRWVGHGARCWR